MDTMKSPRLKLHPFLRSLWSCGGCLEHKHLQKESADRFEIFGADARLFCALGRVVELAPKGARKAGPGQSSRNVVLKEPLV